MNRAQAILKLHSENPALSAKEICNQVYGNEYPESVIPKAKYIYVIQVLGRNKPVSPAESTPSPEVKSNGDQEGAYVAVTAALTLAFESLMNLDLQSQSSVTEGNVVKEIRSLRAHVNRTYSIVKHYSPIAEEKLIDTAMLDRFNALSGDLMLIDDLFTRRLSAKAIVGTEATFYYDMIVPRYERDVNLMLACEGIASTWEELQYDDLTLRRYLLTQVSELGHHLYGQVMLTLVHTLPRDELDRILRSMKIKREGGMEAF